jgi:hypothetical protein
MPTPTPTIRDQERLLHKKLVSTTINEIVDQLYKVLGARLTALVGGLSDPKAVIEYATNARKPQAKPEKRLRDAHRVMALLMLGNLSKEAIQSWFVGMNPDLDDESPSDVILEDPKRVIEAARSFVEVDEFEPEDTTNSTTDDEEQLEATDERNNTESLQG